MTDSPNLYQALLGNWTGVMDPSGLVVVMQHGIHDSSMNGGWSLEVAKQLASTYSSLRADPGQDVLNSVQTRAVRRGTGIHHEQFGKVNAWLASQGILDPPTRIAGARILDQLGRLRAHLDEEPPRQGERISFLAHSHGTAMLLAAAQMSKGRQLDKILLVGSDLNVYTDITPFTRMARKVRNYYSLSDRAVTSPTVTAAGGYGFRTGGPVRFITGSPGIGPLLYLVKPLKRSASFDQVLVPGIKHSANFEERAQGMVSWVGADLARRYYAPFTAIYRERISMNTEEWRRRYLLFRREFGGPLTIRQPQLWDRPYLGRGFLLSIQESFFVLDRFGTPRWQPDVE
jgi:hypothetical protein